MPKYVQKRHCKIDTLATRANLRPHLGPLLNAVSATSAKLISVRCVRLYNVCAHFTCWNKQTIHDSIFLFSIFSTLNFNDNNLPVRNCNVCKLLLWQWWKKFPIPNRPVWMQMASIGCPYLNSPWVNEWEFLHRCKLRNKKSIQWQLAANDVVSINLRGRMIIFTLLERIEFINGILGIFLGRLDFVSAKNRKKKFRSVIQSEERKSATLAVLWIQFNSLRHSMCFRAST